MHLITKNDCQEGRTMGWHGLTKVNELLALASCWLASWDYKAIKVLFEDGTPTPFMALGVTDDAQNIELNVETGEEKPGEGKLIVGFPYRPGSFKPVSNAQLIDLLDKATSGKDVVLASCGTVKNRGRQFFSFEMGKTFRAAGRDFIPYFNVGNGNDKSSPLWQNVSNTCTVCNNTFTANMAQAGLIMEVKKTKFSELRVADFGKAAKAMLAGQKEFAENLNALAKVKCDVDKARQFFAGFIGNPKAPLSTRAENTVDRLLVLFKDNAKGNSGVDFSDVFQALTDYYTHESANGDGTPEARWKNFVSSEFGSALQAKQRAWALLNVDRERDALVKIGAEILKQTAKVK